MAPDQPRRRLGTLFDEVADTYDAVRPGYPGALVDAALERGRLGAGSRVLEVGCGTGKLTELLADRGLLVDAVEPGGQMLRAARRRLGERPGVRFHHCTFEQAHLAPEAFDGVFAASALHWVDPAVAWSKADSLLRPGGLLALLAYMEVRDGASDGLDEEFRALLRRHAPEIAHLPPQRDVTTLLEGARARADNVSEVWDWLMGDGFHGLARQEAARLFRDVEAVPTVSTGEETADHLLEVMGTTSLFLNLPPDRRRVLEGELRRLVESRGGSVRTSLATFLVTARRAARI